MTLDKFIAESGIGNADEVERAIHFAFYHLKKNGLVEFSAGEAATWIRDASLGNPNVTRLGNKLPGEWGHNEGQSEEVPAPPQSD